jgi:hypothetical protein
MRNGAVAAIVIALLLAGTGKLNAQTAEIQQMVATKLALKRLAGRVRIAESIKVLAEAALEEPIRKLQRTGVYLRHLYERLNRRGGEPRSGEERHELIEEYWRSKEDRRGAIERP